MGKSLLLLFFRKEVLSRCGPVNVNAAWYNAVSFRAWVTNFLMPNLRRGDVVAMKENARTRAQTARCIGALIDRTTAEEYANYFWEAGYST